MQCSTVASAAFLICLNCHLKFWVQQTNSWLLLFLLGECEAVSPVPACRHREQAQTNLAEHAPAHRESHILPGLPPCRSGTCACRCTLVAKHLSNKAWKLKRKRTGCYRFWDKVQVFAPHTQLRVKDAASRLRPWKVHSGREGGEGGPAQLPVLWLDWGDRGSFFSLMNKHEQAELRHVAKSVWCRCKILCESHVCTSFDWILFTKMRLSMTGQRGSV